MDEMVQYNQYHSTIVNFIEREYINHFPLELHDQINYLFTDGKKIRPILCLLFVNYKTDSHNNNIILTLCCTIELIHCISLVIDDLPDLDNDETRRDKPAFHIKYGIEYTNFFIYYILNKASTILNDLLINNKFNDISANLKLDLDLDLDIKYAQDILYLFKFNLDNLVDGQYIDMEYYNIASANITIPEINVDLYNLICDLIFTFVDDIDNDNDNDNDNDGDDVDDDIGTKMDNNQEELLYQNIMLNIKKTGTLFALSTSIGHLLNLWYARILYTGNETIIDDSDDSESTSILADNSNNNINMNISKTIKYDANPDKFFNIVAIWGYILGYAFQISDDILDYEIDKVKNKPNVCNILGRENIVKLFEFICNWLKQTADVINTNSVRLWGDASSLNKDVINKIVEKIKTRIN